jgi:hypothetical protein
VIPLPENIAAGIENVSQRGGWNRLAPDTYGLPTEIWREHVARRQRLSDWQYSRGYLRSLITAVEGGGQKFSSDF